MNNVNNNINYGLENNTAISWSVIFAGVITSLGVEVLLNFLGIGIGLISFNMDTETLNQLGYGSIIWLIISGVISMLAGGYVVGAMSTLTCKAKLALYGLITWSLSMLVTLIITASTAGAIIGGSTVVIGNSMTSQQREMISEMINNKISNLNTNNLSDYLPDSIDSKVDKNNKVDKSTDLISKFSISLFLGFLLSAIAGTIAPIMALFRRSNFSKP